MFPALLTSFLHSEVIVVIIDKKRPKLDNREIKNPILRRKTIMSVSLT